MQLIWTICSIAQPLQTFNTIFRRNMISWQCRNWNNWAITFIFKSNAILLLLSSYIFFTIIYLCNVHMFGVVSCIFLCIWCKACQLKRKCIYRSYILFRWNSINYFLTFNIILTKIKKSFTILQKVHFVMYSYFLLLKQVTIYEN